MSIQSDDVIDNGSIIFTIVDCDIDDEGKPIHETDSKNKPFFINAINGDKMYFYDYLTMNELLEYKDTLSLVNNKINCNNTIN